MTTVHATTPEQWRAWLATHSDTATEAQLVLHRGDTALTHEQAVEEALCFGWIDSKSVRRDDHSRYQRFSPRNPRSTWSRVNRERAERLIAQGRMTHRGQALIDHARRTGTWTLLTDADNRVIPADLAGRFDRDPTAFAHYQAFPPSSQRRILAWILTAKRPETRRQRVNRTVELAAANLRANHPV
ncbi:YdeI family protein [Amycolatopsis sp. 195334CR]|uniref:YdeI/OmpD-associated family protein n=1 Tax=Amycolatopsis sp. 195334CR TaxID=2814588 RepID=UPI001A8D6DC4|nr:YdeI/OmpD-associated family protein [Amycolatopsis sp. 195334CR]MBN6039931.1 YdeI/OmpD-associated family protein [Amycolatopsis sp. 195334CR]